MDSWALIRALSKCEGLSSREIARRLGVSRNAVARALASQTPPRYERTSSGSMVDPFVPALRQVLVEHPRMPATVVAERVGFPNRHSSVLECEGFAVEVGVGSCGSGGSAAFRSWRGFWSAI